MDGIVKDTRAGKSILPTANFPQQGIDQQTRMGLGRVEMDDTMNAMRNEDASDHRVRRAVCSRLGGGAV